MKKRTLKRTLCIVLSIVLVTAFNSSMNVFAATTSNQYAYSIGCDHGSWAWFWAVMKATLPAMSIMQQLVTA